MGKLTKKQKKVCNAFIKEVCYLRDNNDTSSSVYPSILKDYVENDLDGICSESEMESLVSILKELYYYIESLTV